MDKKNLQFLFRYAKKIIFSTIIIVILSSPSLRADVDPVLAARLQNAIDSVRNHYNYKGVSVSVYIPSIGSWSGTSGVSHGAVGITPDMKFAIASQTKTFVAVLMLKLQEMNVLSLDDSLHKWIPNFQHVDSNITIRQLLGHTSGVYNYSTHPGLGNAMADTGRFWTPEEILTTFMNPPYFNPGAGFQYSNTNYILAGMVIKAATGNSISQNLRQLILNPLNLTDTYFPVEELVSDTIAHGWHFGVEIKYPRTSSWSSAWSSGAMFSTAENMVRFFKELFNVQIINQTSLNQMLTFPQQPIGIYGLGISNGLFGGRTVFCHSGGFMGYTSITGIDTTAKFIISILVNQAPGSPDNFIVPLSKVILEHHTTNIDNSENTLPAGYSLSQNYPNPFNPSTTIKFALTEKASVTLTVYNMLGEKIKDFFIGEKESGYHQISFDGSNLPSGVYVYRLSAGDFLSTKKMMMIK